MKGSRLHVDLFKIFRDLAETGSFSKAAARNYLTQSAVSQQLSFLERHLGNRLVDRGKGRFALTDAGRIFLDGCRKVLEAYQEAVDGIRHPGEVSGSIKVETIYSIGLYEMALLTKTFMRRYPMVEISVEYIRADRIYSDVIHGECDFGIVAYPWRHPSVHAVPFKRERLVLACPPAARLAKRRKARLADLDGKNFVAFSRDIPTRRAVDDLLRKARVFVNVVHEFDNIETIKRSVEIGAGVSILPEVTVAGEVASGAIAAVALAGAALYRPTAIIYRKDKTLSRAAREFLRWLSR